LGFEKDLRSVIKDLRFVCVRKVTAAFNKS